MEAAGDGLEAVAHAQVHNQAAPQEAPKRVLALPDLEQSKAAVLDSLTSSSGQRTYDHAIQEFVTWYCSEPRLAFTRTVVLRAVLTFRTAVPKALVAGMVVWTMACGGGSIGSVLTPTPTGADGPAAVGTFEGAWIGRTNQGERVEFTVAGAVVSQFSTRVTYAASECTGGAAGGFGMAAAITDLAFAAMSSVPIAGFAWSVDGRFTSPREATGTFQVTFPPPIPPGRPPCVTAIQVSWTAEKHS